MRTWQSEQDAAQLIAGTTEKDADVADTTTPPTDVTTDDIATDIATDGDAVSQLLQGIDLSGLSAQDLQEKGTGEVFFNAMYDLEGVGQPEIRQRLPSLLNQTRALFDLYRGPELYDILRSPDDKSKMADNEVGLQTTADQYGSFLSDYMRNADKYRGLDFRKRVEAVNDYLGEVTGAGFYAPDTVKSKEGVWAAQVLEHSPGTLKTLAKMYRTGGSNDYYAKRVHSQIDNLWTNWTAMGLSSDQIFQRLTRKAPTSTARPRDDTDNILDGTMVGFSE